MFVELRGLDRRFSRRHRGRTRASVLVNVIKILPADHFGRREDSSEKGPAHCAMSIFA